LYGVLDQYLTNREYILSEVSIAEFSIWPWVSRYNYHQIDLNDFPNVKDWYLQLAQRPAFLLGYAQPSSKEPIPVPR
jgi:GST-like protein